MRSTSRFCAPFPFQFPPANRSSLTTGGWCDRRWLSAFALLATLVTRLLFVTDDSFAEPAEHDIHRSRNFVVHASSESIARAVADRAERARTAIALKWHGRELESWGSRCHIDVHTGRYRPGGATTIRYLPGSATAIRMEVTGPLEEIVDNVIPHEVTHAVLASIFRQPLPRWIDEGLAVLSEDESARQRQRLLLREMLRRNPPPLRSLIAAADYPESAEASQTVYLIGFSLTEFVIRHHGRKPLVDCLTTAMEDSWESAVRRHLKYDSLESLERNWQHWLHETAPAVTRNDTASGTTRPSSAG